MAFQISVLANLAKAIKDGYASMTTAGQLTVATLIATTVTFGTLTLTGLLTAGGPVLFEGNFHSQGSGVFNNNFGVGGKALFTGSEGVGITGPLAVTGAVDVNTTLNVDGATTHVGNVTLSALFMASPSTDTTLLTTATLVPTDLVMRVAGSGAAKTLTSTPSISDGTDGQLLILQGTHDTNTLKLQDEAQLADSGIQCNGGSDVTLGKGDILMLVYDAGDDNWYCLGAVSNN